MLPKIKKIAKNPFYQGSVVVLVGSILTGFINYLYHLITGRFLPPEQYGLLESLIALTYFLNVFTQSFSFSVINFVGQTKESLVFPLVKRLEKEALKFSFIFWLFFLVFFPFFNSILHLQSFSPFFIFSFQILFSLLPTVYYSILRARFRFIEFSLIGVFSALFKIICAFFLIRVGWQLTGALWSLVAMGISATALGWFWVTKYWKETLDHLTGRINLDSSFWRYSLLSLLTNVALTSIYSADIILVRAYFSSYQSGIYAAVSVLGKIIFFAATSILLVSFPLFTKFKRDKRRSKRMFWLSFLFLTGFCVLGIYSFKFFPNLVVGLLYGRGYQQAASFLPSFAIFISLLALLNLVIQFLLALEDKMAAVLGGFTAFTQIILIIVRHGSLKIIIDNSITSVAIGLFLGLTLALKILHEKE